jgi:2,4-dienoyl-CoA reductase (NADPH2)
VTLFERDAEVGGQLNLAKLIPGKEEFRGFVDWFATMLDRAGVSQRLGTEATPDLLAGYDEIIIATGVRPRDPGIEGADGANVLGYLDVLRHRAPVGRSVAVVGAGGIGFDVAEFLVQSGESPTENLDLWLREWGVADPGTARAGLAPEGPHPPASARRVTLLQRKPERPGRGLGKTTGWIHRASLAAHGVTMLGAVNYERITPEGLELTRGATRETPELLAVDTVVLCAGQVSERGLADALTAAGRAVHVIGGADLATELDAKRAIDQGVRLAAKL